MITLRMDTTAVEAGLKALGDDAPKAVMRAINRTLGNVRTAMTRAVAQSLGIKQATVRARLHTVHAHETRLQGQIWADAKPLPLLMFRARGPEPSRGRGPGVTASTPTKRYPHAFIATMPSKHRGVFERVPGQFMFRRKPTWKSWHARRQAIRERREASVAAVFIHQERAGQVRADEQLPKNLAHEVQYLLTTKVQAAFNRNAGIRRT